MERLTDDALIIQSLLPWIESHEDIINFMRKIPLDKSHLRNQLSLRYFLKKRDSDIDEFDKSIEDDAREIVLVFPGTSYKEIKDRLMVLGGMPNRREVVLRHLLLEKSELDSIVTEIDFNCSKKRKTESYDQNLFDSNPSSSETNIKIKIRKKDGSLEVVSTIKQEKVSPLKTAPATITSLNEPTSSSSSTSSGTSHSATSSPDSTVPSISSVIDDDPCPEFTSILNKIKQENQPSTSGSVMPMGRKKRSLVPSSNNNNNTVDTGDTNNFNVEEQTSKKTLDNVNDSVEKESKFNLVDFIKEMTLASEKDIIKLCQKLHLNINERPQGETLNYILNQFYDNVVDVDADEANMGSDSDTEEYFKDNDFTEDNYLQQFGGTTNIEIRRPKEQDAAATISSSISVVKEFKLKEPILNLNKKLPPTPTSHIPIPTPKRTISPVPPPPDVPLSSVIRPARFTLPGDQTLAEAKTAPAMPKPLLEFTEPDTETDQPQPIPQTSVSPVDLSSAYSVIIKYPKIAVKSLAELSEPGPSVPLQRESAVDEGLVRKLIEMFPEACPIFIRNVCDGKCWAQFDDVVTEILSNDNYPKRPQRPPSPAKEVDPEEQFEILKELLPDADPDYLRMQCEKYANDDRGLKEFINRAVEIKDYPTMKEYLRKQKLCAQQKQYTTEFSIENFIELFPDPEKSFNDPKRTVKIDQYAAHYIIVFFRNKYDKIPAKTIQQILTNNKYKVIPSNNELLNIKNSQVMKCRRKAVNLPDNLQNIPLLQELAYIDHKHEIEEYMKEKQRQEELDRLETKKNGLMQSCQCCYDDEVMPKHTFTCPNGCKFCKECIQKSCEVAFGEGKTLFPCLADCSSEFTLQTLQHVLPPKMFSKLAQKKALAEITAAVKAAGIEELETCPFCDFASIPNEGDKIFRCLNPDCMKESCRSCKEQNHIPLRCEEVEKDEEVKARIHVEDAMTKALLRNCWKCGTSFFKEEGCNKMTCSCGAQMCYICKKPVNDYTHFNGIGGDQFQLCPLYSDTNLVNQQNVLGAAEAAKAEIDASKLKVDPTVDVIDHYKNRKKELPNEPYIQHLVNYQWHPVPPVPNVWGARPRAPQPANIGPPQMPPDFLFRLQQQRLQRARDQRARARHRHMEPFQR